MFHSIVRNLLSFIWLSFLTILKIKCLGLGYVSLIQRLCRKHEALESILSTPLHHQPPRPQKKKEEKKEKEWGGKERKEIQVLMTHNWNLQIYWSSSWHEHSSYYLDYRSSLIGNDVDGNWETDTDSGVEQLRFR